MQQVMNQHSVQEDVGSIPVEDLASLWLYIGLSRSSNSTPSTGTSICPRCSHKKEKESARESHRIENSFRAHI